MVPALSGMEREACVTLALKQDGRKDDALDRMWAPSEIVTADRLVRAREAVHGPFPEGIIDTRLREVLAARGVKQLYRHQAEAVGCVLAGQSVVVVTPPEVDPILWTGFRHS